MAGTSKQYNVIVSERAADMLIRQIRFFSTSKSSICT